MNNVWSSAQFRKNLCDKVEHNIQKSCIRWFDLQYPGLLIYAIPNGGKRDKGTAKKLTAEGVRRGIPDLHLAVTCDEYKGLYIETKTQDGKPSQEQLVAHSILRGQGYQVELVRNLEQFMTVVNEYLALCLPN